MGYDVGYVQIFQSEVSCLGVHSTDHRPIVQVLHDILHRDLRTRGPNKKEMDGRPQSQPLPMQKISSKPFWNNQLRYICGWDWGFQWVFLSR